MVQIIQRPPGFGERLGLGLAEGFNQRREAIQGEKSRDRLLQKESELSRLSQSDRFKHEMDKMQEVSRLNRQEQTEKLKGEYSVDDENFSIIKDAFGEKFANVWKASPTGARTALTQAALEARSRGVDLNEMIGKLEKEHGIEESSSEGQQGFDEDFQPSKELSAEGLLKSPSKENKSPEYQLPTEGMNAKDIVSFKSALRKDNTPIWQDNKNRLTGSKDLKTDIKILDQLNKKGNLPEKLSKLLINPETGAPYEAVTAVKNMHPDVQRWVKTIARQSTQAQSAFPGRVTNFDLQSYMRQFPSLFNSAEGRDVILKQMNIINEMHELRENALNNVYTKYKLGGVTPEDAYDLADKMVEKQVSELEKKLLDLAEEGEILGSEVSNMSGKGERQSLAEIFG